jgi:UDP-N-acetylmuramate--alanine ligase
VDAEHLDHYGNMESLIETFISFGNKVPFYGFAVVCLDHPVIQDMLPSLRRRVVTYGFSRQADYRAENLTCNGMDTTFDVSNDGVVLGSVTIGMPGRHNVQNAMAAISATLELDVSFDVVKEALHQFTGVERRFSVRGSSGSALIVDDYGHHPVEIEATLAGAVASFPEKKIVAVFQPHRFTRVRDLMSDFCRAFHKADHVIVCPVYAAGEDPIEGVDRLSLLDGIKSHGHRSAIAVDSLEEAALEVEKYTEIDSLVVTLGAGSVNQVCDLVLERA